MNAIYHGFEADTEFFEFGAYRAEISFKQSFTGDRLHWRMKHWGRADGCIANGHVHRFNSIHAARHAAEQWVSRGL